jgi:polyhydroxybutyrate depolymerase
MLLIVALLLMVVSTWTAMALAPTGQPTVAALRPDLSGVVGDRTVTLSIGTGPRSALVHHPDSAVAGAPLVVVLHGESGSAKQARDDYGWNALADREGFVVAYPESVGNSWNLSPDCCGQAHIDHLNDLGFLHQLVSAIGKVDLIARNRVFAVGFSDGATLAYTWACSLPGELAGIGPVAGSLAIDCPIVAPVSLAVVRGTADRPVLLASTSRSPSPGATSPTAAIPGQREHRSTSLEATLTLFRTLDNCPADPETTTVLPVTQRSWSCVATRTVSAAVINDAGHQWPGAEVGGHPDERTGVPGDQPSSALSATDWLWAHLRNSRSR